MDMQLTISAAVERLLRGELVVLPTETVYGIACDAGNPAAVAKLIAAKNRPDGKPFSWLVADLDCCESFTEVTDDAWRLAERFFPGALTLVLNTRAGATVGIRGPAHEITLQILRETGAPLACPSANLSGQSPPTTFADAIANFGGAIPGVDGGDCEVGVESTVLDLTRKPPKILRHGAITKRKLEKTLGRSVDGMTVIGFTGGTGAGKTTALRAVSALGGLVIDCDEVYHELLESDAELLGKLASEFPDAFEDGKLLRRKLGGIVFRDAQQLATLNSITHGFVKREVSRKIREFDASGGSLVAVEAIELVSSGISDQCDYLIAVTAPRETRVLRIMQRENLTREQAELRIAAQRPDEYYTAGSDMVLTGSFGSPEEFEEYCTGEIRKLTRAKNYEHNF
jgi:tRNA threonylcarbamoyl adenosine modification protein (Sua5/YciO/YrdC/YwlC family)/dephospho-CoA kinase